MVECAHCKSVADAIEKKTAYPGEYVWKYRDVQQNAGCITCQKIALRFKIHTRTDYVGDWTGYVSYSQYDDNWELTVSGERVKGRETSSHYLFLEIHEIPNTLGFCLFDQEIDIEGIKKWISRCEKDHAGICHTITNPRTKMPDATELRFIDVEKHCLVKQLEHDGDGRYAALSYVWGTAVDPFQTVKANAEALSQEYAFDLPCNRTRLPKTIVDSISFTRALGLRYLWVDRFSIIQDDEVAKPHQLASMASIYSNAYVTIAATEGEDSAYGLPGVNKERPRKPPSEVYHFSPSCRVQVLTPLRGEQRTVYHTRGWTFQEWTFSRRTIVFHDQSVSWICGDSDESESKQYRHVVPTKLLRWTWDTYPNFRGYCSAVEVYNKRKLTYSEDILAAFDAFMTVQGRAMKSGFVFGIPELFLPNMLCWHHGQNLWHYSEGRLQQRRTDAHGNILKAFPSWSWVGWSGPVNMNSADAACRLATRKLHCSTLEYPHLIEFSKVIIEPHDERKEYVKDLHYYETRGLISLAENEYYSSRLPIKVFDKHPMVRENEVQSLTAECVHSTILEFRTRRLIASLSKHDRDDLREETPILTGPEGQILGILDIDISLNTLQLPQHEVELICICVGRVVCTKHAQLRDLCQGDVFQKTCPKECFPDWNHFAFEIHTPASKWQYMAYHVLWIEWEDGIAYRKAIGHVWKDEWDAADTEEVDIRLG
ncbi:heterokaryon incompatibility protein-domain-containing protein [Alternaria rosae]|uniref:heterokaryon incompatibility protein-domain-containing protein n=1 Tax=Alternaria rosae TaxID=1187941 RepID=UPI001E8CECD2|nr:heterokaryon incompatibility protein-domain-containing protein [Alternaria rosae]KAH6865775.1 heterokaryon incompatibility protein-domain-containing protein [Alternaria rosae]